MEPIPELATDGGTVFDKTGVVGASSFSCLVRVMTKDVVDDALEGTANEASGDIVEVKGTIELAADGTEGVVGLLDVVDTEVGSLTNGGGDERGGDTGAGGDGAGGASSPLIGFAWFCPGRGLVNVIAGKVDDSLGFAGRIGGADFGSSPMSDVSWLTPGNASASTLASLNFGSP